MGDLCAQVEVHDHCNQVQLRIRLSLQLIRTSYLRGAEGDHVHIKLITPVYRIWI